MKRPSLEALAPNRRLTSDGEKLAVSNPDCANGTMCFEEIRAMSTPFPSLSRRRVRSMNSKGEFLAFDEEALVHEWSSGCDEKQFEEVRLEKSSRYPCLRFSLPGKEKPLVGSLEEQNLAVSVKEDHMLLSEMMKKYMAEETDKQMLIHDEKTDCKKVPEELMRLLQGQQDDAIVAGEKTMVVKLSRDASYDITKDSVVVPYGDKSSKDVLCFKVGIDTSVIAQFTMKVSSPAHWSEYYISSVCNKRLGKIVTSTDDSKETDELDSAKHVLLQRKKFLQWSRAHFYVEDDISVLLTNAPSWRFFSLQTLHNALIGSRSKMEEPLVLYIVVELLSLVQILHSIGIVMGHVTTNGFCINGSSASTTDDILINCTDYGWSTGGLMVTDFSFAVDTQSDLPETFFNGCDSDDKEVIDNKRISQMINGGGIQHSLWFEQDLHGIACVIHRLLHGFDAAISIQKQTLSDTSEEWCFETPLKRYWHTSIWTELFRALLNAKHFANGMESSNILKMAREPLIKLIVDDSKLRREIRAQLNRAVYILGDYNSKRRSFTQLSQ